MGTTKIALSYYEWTPRSGYVFKSTRSIGKWLTTVIIGCEWAFFAPHPHSLGNIIYHDISWLYFASLLALAMNFCRAGYAHATPLHFCKQHTFCRLPPPPKPTVSKPSPFQQPVRRPWVDYNQNWSFRYFNRFIDWIVYRCCMLIFVFYC